MAHISSDLIRNLMRKYNVPGVSIALIKNGIFDETHQYGFADAERENPVQKSTFFEACSMTKPFFAYAALKLVEQGAMDLDVPLVKYLGKPYIKGEPLHKKITMRMVLAHTCGFPNWREGGRNSGAPLPVDFEPGSQFQYSGEGFWFLQKTVEHLTRVPINQWLEKQLLCPLKMQNSSLVWNEKVEKMTASGHDENGKPKPSRNLFTEANAAFSLYTTPTDYAQFLVEILDANHSLNQELWKEMLSPQVEVPGDESAQNQRTFRGLGWEIIDIDGNRKYRHSGSNLTGFRCVCQFDLISRDGIVLMTNADNGDQLWRRSLATL